MKVAVLLATYNGEKFVQEQLDSIINQSYKDFTLYISDDGSSDCTVAIIKEYQEKYPNVITVLDNHKPTGSAKGNFFYLLEQVDSDVYLFCDQDDVWTANHIEVFVTEYCSLSETDKSLPILIHSDLSVVDENLNLISESMIDYLKLPKNPHRHFYLVQNNVTGCVSMVNDALKKLVIHNKILLKNNMDTILMHDCFITLVAVFFGKKIFIDKSTNLYRQHGKNVVGAGEGYSFKQNIKKIFSLERNKATLEQYKRMLSFYVEYFPSLGREEKGLIKTFVHINEMNKYSRIIFLVKNRILKYGCFRNLILLYFV